MGGHDRQCLGSDWLWFCVLSLETVGEGQEHLSLASGCCCLGSSCRSLCRDPVARNRYHTSNEVPDPPVMVGLCELGWPAERDEDGEGKQSKAWKVAQRGWESLCAERVEKSQT